MIHRYDDCVAIQPGDDIQTDEDDRQVTCNACREYLGLDPIDIEESER